MNLFAFVTIAWFVLALAALVLCAAVIWLRSGFGAVWPFSWKFLLVVTVLLPLNWYVIAPHGIAWFAAGRIGTRSFERDYPGPTIDGELVPPVHFEAADGVRVQGYFMPRDPAVPSVDCAFVVVHGLFRNALEIEPVGQILRGLGVDVLLLEVRNHGGSGRATPTFGRDEALDVAAGVNWLRKTRGAKCVGAFGVSLGGISVALATRLVDLNALVIDAPIADPEETARDTLSGSRRISVPDFMVERIVRALENRLGVRFADVQPLDALVDLPSDVPVLLFGGSDDRRVPVEALRAYFDALPTRADQKSLWVGQGAGHGKVWIDYPEEYRTQLERLIERMR